MKSKGPIGTAIVAAMAWLATGMAATAYADEAFDGCTFYTRMKVAGNAGNACPVIDTGFKPCGTTSIDAKYRQFELTGTSCLFSSRDKANGSGPYFTYFSMVNGGAARWDYVKNLQSTGVNSSLDPNYRLIITNGIANLHTSLDRKAIATASQTPSTFAATYNLYLFGSNTGSTSFDNGARLYFYYLKAYDGPISDGKLLHHYVPCKTSDGLLGVADLVDEKVYLPKQHATALSVADTDSIGGVRPTVGEAAFTKVATFTASGYAGSEALDDFPTLVRLSTSISGFSYDDCGENGANIRFADSDGKLLAHEIDTWNTSGESLIWVNIPKLSSATTFKMYVGGDGSTATLPVSSIWRRAGYKFVFHNNVTATTAGADSAGSGLVGVVEQSALAVNASVAGAPLGSCEDMVNCNSGGGSHGWHIDNNTYWGGHGGQLSMSIWTYRTDTSDAYNRALIGSPAKYVASIYTSTTTGHLTIGGNLDACNVALPVKSGNWMHINAVCDTKYYQFYQNGVQASGMSLATAMADNTTATFAVGSKNLSDRNKGYLDEARLRWEASTADWVKAEYDTVGNASFLACGGFFAVGEGPDSEDWEYSFTIALGDVLQSAIGSETLSSFPLLVRLSTNSISGFKYSDFKVENGGDLVFLDASGNFLEYEIDTWDTNGVSLVWVKIPSLTANTGLTCRYHGPEYSHTPSKTWSNYVGVWHMNEESGTAVDATGHGLDGTPTGTSAASVMVGTAGVVGKSRINQAQTGKINGMLIPNYNSHITTASKFSVGGWYKATGGNGYARPMSRKTSYSDNTGFEIEFTDGSVTDAKVCGSSGTQVAYKMPNMTQGWCNLLYVFDGATVTVYTNGYMSVSGTITAVVARDAGLMFGNNLNCAEAGWYGMYDELRFYDGVLSAARVRFDHLVQSEDSALDLGMVQTPDPELPRLKYCEAEAISNGNIVVSGSVLRHSGEVTVTLTADGRKSIVVNLGEIAADDTFEREFTDDDGLVKFVTYTVSIGAANGEKVAETTLPNEVKYGKVEPTDFDSKFSIDLSAEIRTLLGTAAYTNFPVLVRLPAEASALLQSGNDVMVRDQTGAELAWDLETWNPSGVSYLWVKVPELSSSTVLTGYVGCAETEAHDASAVWSRYVGVWHFASGEAGGSTAKDSTGHALDGTTTGTFATLDGPFGDSCTMAGAKVTAPNYETAFSVGSKFTASGWFKFPTMVNTDYATVIKKKGGTWNAANGWYLEMSDYGKDSAFTTLKAILTASTPSTKISDVRTNWHYYQAVSDGSTFKVYLDGSTSAAISSTYTVVVNSEQYMLQSSKEATDECRIRKGAASAAETRLEYLTMKNESFFTCGELEPTDPAAPVLGEPVFTPSGEKSFTITETITGNMPKAGSVKVYYNGAILPMTTTDTAVPATYTLTITPSESNKTDIVEVRAKSEAGSSRMQSTCFYSGALTIEKVRDASEKGLTNGIWRIARADKDYSLPVALDRLATTTATAGVDYVDFPMTTAIPKGTNAVDIVLTPIINLSRNEDTWIDLAISNGAYRIDAEKGSARLTIKNYEIPSGGNVWCATAAGKASVGSNWTAGFAPLEGSDVMFDGDVSSADCEWDVDAAHSLSSWTQNAQYTGTVTIDTTYGDSFPQLEVTGDMLVMGGKLTQHANASGDNAGTYRLKLVVGGIFNLASGTQVDCSLKGFWGACKPSGSQCGAHAASGDGYQYVYGDVYRPADLGAGCANAGDATDLKCGGGAVWIECGGKAAINGTVNVRGRQFDGGNSGCGSVYLKARSCDGSGKIYADFSATGYYNGSKGSAGRVGIELTEATSLGLPIANIGITGCCSGSSGGGGGTLFVKTAADTYGTLYLDDTRGKSYGARWQRWKAITAIPQGQSWTFDRIVIANYGMLCVPPNTELHLPNGPESVSASSERQGGLFYQGGVIDFGERDTYEFSGNWIFQANKPYTFDGDVVVKKGGAIGCLRFTGNNDLSDFAICDITVNGNLTVEEGGYVYANGGGPDLSINRTCKASHGGIGAQYGTVNAAYDSIFAPQLPGYGVSLGDQAESCAGGGVVKLSVTNTLTVYGAITANGHAFNSNAGAAGGAIDIRANDLRGTGIVRANSATGSNDSGGTGGGGRIAIHLGANAACTDKVFSHLYALGITKASGSMLNSSAGTIYLCAGAERENGVVTIKNDGNALNDNTFTPFPVGSSKYGVVTETAEDLKYTSLSLEGAARVMLTDNLDNAMLKLVNSTRLDLAGKEYVVRTAYVNGSKVELGTYEAGDEPFGDVLEDSVGGGSLRITGYGLWVFVQ